MDDRPTRAADGSWWSRRVRSFVFAGRGLWWLLSSQPNARTHLVATFAVVAVSVWLSLSAIEWSAVLLAIGLVWTAEGLNSALEALADRVAPGQHPLVGRAKDVAAGAVLAASLAAALVGVLILGPKLLARLG